MDDQRFEEFLDGCLPALGRYAYVLTGSRHAGEDLVQDTVVKLMGAWRRVRADGNPVGYARSVMFRTYVSRWRVVRKRPNLEPYEQEPPAAGDAYADVEVRDLLRRALAELPRLQRAVLVLGYLDDLPDPDIAALLGRRPATVRSLRMRALAAVRARMVDADDLEVTHGSH